MIAARRLTTIAATLALLTAATARADQSYDVSGNDSYQIGVGAQATVISYSGTQQLTETDSNDTHRFVALAHYTRTDDDRSAVLHARFVQDLERDGSFDDMSDED